jgi:hypothetical protein
VDGTGLLINCQQKDEPFYLPPVTEMDMVALVQASTGTGGRFIASIGAKSADQIGRVVNAFAAGQIWQLHGAPPLPLLISIGRPKKHAIQADQRKRWETMMKTRLGISRFGTNIPLRDRSTHFGQGRKGAGFNQISMARTAP